HRPAYRVVAPASLMSAFCPPKGARALSLQATGTRRFLGREQVRVKSMQPTYPASAAKPSPAGPIASSIPVFPGFASQTWRESVQGPALETTVGDAAAVVRSRLD